MIPVFYKKSLVAGLLCICALTRGIYADTKPVDQAPDQKAEAGDQLSLAQEALNNTRRWGDSRGHNKSVEIKGNVRIDKHVILDRIALLTDNVDPEKLNEIIHTLVATGFFKNVSAVVENNGLVVTVEENPSISQIVFEGNRSASDTDLKKIINMRTRQVLSTVSVAQAAQMIRDFYKIKGRYAAVVTTQMIKRDSNRVDVIFKIAEGRRALISKILFKGNRKVSASILSDVITSSEETWYSFLAVSTEIYSQEVLSQDKEKIRTYYQSKGYMDVTVSDAYAELCPNQKDFVLTFHINEGKRYAFGLTKIKSSGPKQLPLKLVEREVFWQSGQWFNMPAVEQIAQNMTYKLNAKGYPFVEVVPETTRCGSVINVTFLIRPIEPCYVGRITIQGNIKTNDEVIRRELSLKDGDPITAFALKKSENALNQLGFFEASEIVDQPSQDPRVSDVLVRVKEKMALAESKASGGYNSANGFFVSASVSNSNFMGTGRSLGLSGMVSPQIYGLNLATKSPYFLGRRVTVGFDMGVSRQKNTIKPKNDLFEKKDERNGYAQIIAGMGVSASYLLGPGLVQSWSYRPSSQTLNFLSPTTSIYLVENIAEHKTRFISTLGHQLAYRKSFVGGGRLGNKGFVISTNNQFTGLGGSVRYMTNSIQGLVYCKLDEQGNYQLRLEGQYQLMSKLGYVRFMDQFFIGGFSLPGFEESGIGPRDLRTKDSLGGRNAYVASVKLDFAIPSPQDLRFRGCLHAHIGSLWNSIFTPIPGHPIGSQVFKNRVTVGAGLFTEVPMLGKIGIIFSNALVKDKCDQEQIFEFVFGREF